MGQNYCSVNGGHLYEPVCKGSLTLIKQRNEALQKLFSQKPTGFNPWSYSLLDLNMVEEQQVPVLVAEHATFHHDPVHMSTHATVIPGFETMHMTSAASSYTTHSI